MTKTIHAAKQPGAMGRVALQSDLIATVQTDATTRSRIRQPGQTMAVRRETATRLVFMS